MHKLIFLIPVFFYSLVSTGQVQLTLQIPNLGSPYLSDYTGYQGNRVLIITNQTGQAREIFLRGKIEQLNQPGYYLRTKETFRPAAPIALGPFETKTLFATSGDWAFIEERQLEDNIPAREKRTILTTGILPEGEYQICVRAFDFNTEQPVSPDEPVGCQFFMVTLGSPPQILLPACDDTLSQEYPLISWAPAILAQALPAVQYDLYIVELVSRALNPAEVMEQSILYRGGNPFVVENLRTTFYQFLPGDPPLKKGSRYAMCVVARDNRGSALFENQGRSEICIIHVRDDIRGPVGPAGPGTHPGPIVGADPGSFQLLPVSSISGKLLYRFYGDQARGTTQGGLGGLSIMQLQPGQSLQNMGYVGVNQGQMSIGIGYYGGMGNAGFNNSSFEQPPPPQYMLPAGYTTAGGKPLPQAKVRFTARYAVGKKPNIQYPGDLEYIGDFGYSIRVTGPGLPEQLVFPKGIKVVASTITDNAGNYSVSFLADETFGMIEAGTVTVQWGGGEFPMTTSGYGFYRVITMEVEEKWYCHPDIVIFLQPGQTLEAPTQVVTVQSYNMRVRVISNEREEQAIAPGDPIPDAVVKIGRSKYQYDQLPACFPRDEMQIEDYAPLMMGSPQKNYHVGDSGLVDVNGRYTFRRLVKHYGGGGCVEAGGFGSGVWPADGYYVEAYTKPSITTPYHYNPGRFTNIAPCPARLTFLCYANDCAPRSADYVPPTVDQDLRLAPLLPKILAYSQALYYNERKPLAKTTLLMNVYHPNNEYRLGIFKTDENGFFTKQFTYPGDFYDKLIASDASGRITTEYIMEYFKSGFKSLPCNTCGAPDNKQQLEYGLKWIVEPLLEPRSWAKGKVKDEHGQPIYGKVRIGDGPLLPLEMAWQIAQGINQGQTGIPFVIEGLNNLPVQGQQGVQQTGNQQAGIGLNLPAQGSQEGISVQQNGFQIVQTTGIAYLPNFEQVSVFSHPAQSGNQLPLIIVPEATNYFPDTFYVDIPSGHQPPGYDLGTFVIREKLHRPKVIVYHKTITGFNQQNGQPIFGLTPLQGAEVLLSNFPAKTTNAQGAVTYVFGSPSNEFRLRINRQGYVPYDQYVTIPVTKEEYLVEVELIFGHTVTGVVTRAADGLPLAGVRIHTEIGTNDYGPILVEAETNANGQYTLEGLPQGPLVVKAAKSDPDITYIGQSKTVNFTPATQVNFQLQEAPFTLTHIWNLPVDLESATPSGNNWNISGAFITLPENERFRPENDEQRLFFTNITVKPAGPPGPNGKVPVEPVSSTVPTNTPKFRSILNQAHVVEMRGHMSSSDQFIYIYDPNYQAVVVSNIRVQKGTGGNGLVKVRAFSQLEYFRMSYSYDGQFYLGETSESPVINAYKGTADLSMPESYFLMNHNLVTGQVSNPSFMVENFDAYCERKESYVRNDSFILATKLIVDLPLSNPDKLTVSTGNVIVTPNLIKINSGDQPLEFDLETWHVKTGTWEFDPLQGGIVTSAVITTNVIEFPAPYILIKPTSLQLPPANQINLNQISLGGVVDLQMKPGAKLAFDYLDPTFHDPYKGHWRVQLSNQQQGQPVAGLKGLPGWSPQTEVAIQSIENYSDGFEKINTLPNQVVNHYNVINQTVSQLFISDGYIQLHGNTNLNIPNLSNGNNATFVYYKEQNQVKVRVQGLSTTFETSGQVEFRGDEEYQRIVLNWNHFEVTGDLKIYDDQSDNVIGLRAKLIKKPNDIRIKIIDVDAGGELEGANKQVIVMGGGSDGAIHVLQGEQKVVQNAWAYLGYQGQFVGFGSSFDPGGDLMWYVATGAVTNDQTKDDQIDLVDIETPFGDISISFDFGEMALVGDLRIANISMGTVYINEGVANLRVGGLGFYLVAHLDATYPVIGPLSTNFIVGYYPHINPDAQAILKKDMYIQKLPNFLLQSGIQGLYICANKTFFEVDWEVDLLVFAIGIYAEAGVDARFWLNFGESYGAAHIGGLAYADFELYVNVLGLCEICFGLLAELGFDAEYQWTPNEFFDINICGSIFFNVSFCGTDFDETAKLVLGWTSASNDVYYDAVLGESCSGNASSLSGGCKHF